MPYIYRHLTSLNFPQTSLTTDIFSCCKLQRITVPPPDVHAEPTPASTVAFDTQQELLWVGNEYVSVYTTQLTGMDAHEL